MIANPKINDALTMEDSDGFVHITINQDQKWNVIREWKNETMIDIEFQCVQLSLKKEIFNKYFEVTTNY